MRRFECVEGGSSKFWEVLVEGAQLQVRFGRIGTEGQRKDKDYASAAAAQAEAAKLIREKTGKGYREIARSDAESPPVAPSPSTVPAVAAASVTPAQAPKLAAVSLPHTPAPPVAAAISPMPRAEAQSVARLHPAPSATLAAAEPVAPEPQPPGQFLWTPTWKRLLPPWRGEAVPAVAAVSVEASLAELQRGVDKARARIGGSPGALAMLGATTAAELYAVPPSADLEAWSARCVQLMIGARQMHGDMVTARAMWRLALAIHGLPFALAAVMHAVYAAPPLARDYTALIEHLDLPELRARCAAAAEGEYAELLEIAKAQAQRSPLLASLAAFLFPTEQALVALAVSQLGEKSEQSARPHLLTGCRLSETDAVRLIQHMGNTFGLFEATRELLLCLARLGHPVALELAFQRAQRDHYAERRRPYLEIARAHDSAAALAGLIARIDDKDARALLDGFAHQWPQLAIRLAGEREVQGPDPDFRKWLQRLASSQRAALHAARATATGALRALFDEIATALPAELIEAPLVDLPDWLRQPPWRARKRSAPSYPALAPPDRPAALIWLPGERARWQEGLTPEILRQRIGALGESDVHASLRYFGVPDSLHATVLAGEPPPRAMLGPKRSQSSSLLMLLPQRAAQAVLRAWGAESWYLMDGARLEMVIAWLDAEAIAALEHFLRESPERGLQLAQALASPQAAPVAASLLRHSKRARPVAQSWLLRHGELAATVLLAQLGERKQRADASFALRWLEAQGRGAQIEAAAADYGAAGREALAAWRADDPLQQAPARLPSLPEFWQAQSYARPQLLDGRALPVAVLDAIGEMLAFSPLEPRFAGLDRLRELCRADSLSRFAWDLFEAWLVAGAANKEAWAFHALAHLGDEDAARRLARLIRGWPSEGASARAASGLDVLAAMGSEVALMLLHGIAQKVKSKPLQEKARAKIEQLALAQGLSAEDMADRLVPDLGLDDNGSLLLDFGPRQFRVGFDEHLKPLVYAADGSPLKDLPAPLKSDDAERSAQATARYKGLKKDVRTLGSQQIQRLERAMIEGRRWRADAFRRCFVEHPLLRHLSRRLLWARYAEGQCLGGFRVAEDLSYANAQDDLLVLDDSAEVGIVHPLQLSPADAAAFGQIFADYEILQPFAQLGREVYRMGETELDAEDLPRCAGRTLPTLAVFALQGRGWQHEGDTDGGNISSLRCALGDHAAELDFSPGYIVGNPRSEPKQTLHGLRLSRAGGWATPAGARWRDVDPLRLSEMLRDVEKMLAT